MPGTDTAYDAMRCPVLTRRMAAHDSHLGRHYAAGKPYLPTLCLCYAPICLRSCNAMTGTGLCACCAISGTDLRTCYAIPGTHLCAFYAIPSTDLRACFCNPRY
eukprot:3306331-Rhodomonas_salina.1